MKKNVLIVISILMSIGMYSQTVITPPEQGNGSRDNPYIIKNMNDLRFMCWQTGLDKANLMYKLNNNITVTGYWNEAKEGAEDDMEKQFHGLFDGNGYTITVSFDNNHPNQLKQVGCIVGVLGSLGEISNLSVQVNSNKVFSFSNQALGGIVAINYGVIYNCHIKGSRLICYGITEDSGGVGGIAGINCGSINRCSNTLESVESWSSKVHVGGIAGINAGIISHSYVKGDVKGENSDIGGLVGRFQYLKNSKKPTIFVCYSIGNILSNQNNANIGGLVGNCIVPKGYYPDIYSCYTVTEITGGKNRGGLIGKNDYTAVKGCYFDALEAGVYAPFGVNTSTELEQVVGYFIEGIMKKKSSYPNFNFDGYWWNIQENFTYPYFGWQPLSTVVPTKYLLHEDGNITDKINSNLNLSVYPNPTTGIVYIETAEENPDISVYDLNGTLIMRTTEKKIDFSPYTDGMYILKVNGQMEKVIKN